MKNNDWDILKKRGITPENLSVKILNLSGCTGLTSLPDNLRGTK